MILVRFINPQTNPSTGRTYEEGKRFLDPTDVSWARQMAFDTAQIEFLFTDPQISDIPGLQAALEMALNDATMANASVAQMQAVITTVQATLTALQATVGGKADKTITVNGQALSGNVTLTIPSQYTDEMAQDAVGGILTDSTTVDFTYNDGANTITAIVPNGAIGTSQLSTGVNSTLTASSGKQDTITVTAPITKTGNNLAITNVTTTTAGAMSAADKVKLDGLQTIPDQVRMATTTTFNVLGLGNADYPVTWDTPFTQLPGKTVAQTVAAIQIKRFFNGASLSLLGNVTAQEKAGTRSLTGVTFTVNNGGLTLLNTGNLDVLAVLSGQS